MLGKKGYFDKLFAVTPGIRSRNSPHDDQSRTTSAYDAIRMGASYIVVGRPITDDSEPGTVADRIVEEIARATSNLSGV